jgi:hypothetical protein
MRILRVVRPCDRKWDDLVGDDRARFCGDCGKNVHNLLGLSEDEVAALRRESPSGFCGTYVETPWLRSRGAMAALLSLALGNAACTEKEKPREPETKEELMERLSVMGYFVDVDETPSPSPKLCKKPGSP